MTGRRTTRVMASIFGSLITYESVAELYRAGRPVECLGEEGSRSRECGEVARLANPIGLR